MQSKSIIINKNLLLSYYFIFQLCEWACLYFKCLKHPSNQILLLCFHSLSYNNCVYGRMKHVKKVNKHSNIKLSTCFSTYPISYIKDQSSYKAANRKIATTSFVFLFKLSNFFTVKIYKKLCWKKISKSKRCYWHSSHYKII